uniref:Uncharacterized protein n=1 Tax=Anopheles epiroticus TaxID=199890 RepID=A0A182PUL9_9DIPT
MFTIFELPQAPVMVAGLFCGLKKPESLEEYLHPMVNELNCLMQRGININGFQVAIKLRAIVADTPARAFIKVKNIPTGDKLHLVDLGVHKRFVIGCRDGTIRKIRWTKQQCDEISTAIEKIKLPTEIHRKIRPIKQAHFWKASESASFLHYAGFVVLKSYLTDREYKHYLLLFGAVTLFSSSIYRGKWEYAGTLINKYVEEFGSIYGERYITSNVHNLQHLQEEVEQFGPLHSFSSYCFENKLQHLKKLLRCGWKQLQQAVNRLMEYEEYKQVKPSISTYPSLSKRGSIVSLYLREGFLLQNNAKNCWYMTKENTIYQFQTAIKDGNLRIHGRKLIGLRLAFDEPYDSSILN